MTEEQMRLLFERVLQGRDTFVNTVVHYFLDYFALRGNNQALAD